MNIAKYFWELNGAALAETRKILKDADHPQFPKKMAALLSRCDKPSELFSIVRRKIFIAVWPRVRSYWMRQERVSPQRDWWDALYEQMLELQGGAPAKIAGQPSVIFQRFGRMVKEKRLEAGLNQKQLARLCGLSQPVVSQIEEGRQNATFSTLIRLGKVLGLSSLDLSV